MLYKKLYARLILVIFILHPRRSAKTQNYLSYNKISIMMEKKIAIYPAAALFNGRETHFNSQLVEGLKGLGYKTNFPQRDGFEFGNLTEVLSGKLQQDQIGSAVQNIIYFLDMGVFVPKSDVVLANLDEPLDEGVMIETSYAKLMGKFVIGLRTDVRSPYGIPTDNFGGMHFFPAYQTHQFIHHYMPSKTPEERNEQMSSLVQRIDNTIKTAGITHINTIPKYAKNNPNLQPILEGADLLFSGITDIHSERGLEKIASRYIKYQERLKEIGPKLL
ncbi:MAG: nucleoside 2-deoxyribosyltransferase [Nanoarchaeota archaeon]|nr:nucleoside 2-deoxyribosyltransferase [Nanoarchaeota archaeon]